MNNQDRLELELLRNRQLRLTQDLDALSYRLRAFEERMQRQAATEAAAQGPPPLPPAMSQATPQPIPQIPEVRPAESAIPLRVSIPAPESQPVPEPPPGAGSFEQPGVKDRVGRTGTSALRPVPRHASHAEPVKAPAASESFEMRLGTYWFVRIGIVLLLTALAFLANFAYQNLIFKMAAPGKVAMLYVASSALLAVGAWLQRKQGKESLKNYAQVLLAGGLAAVYFTTYAAHHVERLRVIQNPVVDGMLLLAWAGVIVWLADRKKSELMALFALGLAYYTSVITRTGAFTLYSNLVLTVASVFFLWRNRWAVLSAISLPATYLGYAFWRFYAPTGWRFPGAEEGLMFSAAFLGAYWLVFTAAVFLARQESFRAGNRALFLSFNNGAALALFLLTMAQLQTGGLWKVCLGFGSVLLVLSLLSRRLLADDPLVHSAYLVQGLALVTAGFIAKFSGMNLALLLAAESVIVFFLGCRLESRILRGGGWISGLMAVGAALDAMNAYVGSSAYSGLGVGLAMFVNAFFADKRSASQQGFPRAEVSWFTVLMLAAIGAALWTHAERGSLSGLMLVSTMVLTASVYLIRIREIVVFSQALALVGHLTWLANAVARNMPWEPWTEPALVLITSLALMHWWQRQRTIALETAFHYGIQAVYALGVVSVTYTWTMPHVTQAGVPWHYVAVLTGIVLALTAYATVTRAAVLAICSQLLLAPVVVGFFPQVMDAKAPWQGLLVVPLALFLLAAGAVAWLRTAAPLSESAALSLRRAARVYAWVGLALLGLHVASYVPARNCPWVFALISIIPFVWAGFREGELLEYAGALIFFAFLGYTAPMREDVWAHLPNLAFIAILLAQQRAARRLAPCYAVPELLHRIVIITGGLCLWLLMSTYVRNNVTGFLLTVAWSALALVLFGFGMALRERAYRWLGLAVLGCSLGRVVLLDVWKLDTIYRILSFMALGVVLLLLGYFYNRFQEKIRAWL